MYCCHSSDAGGLSSLLQGAPALHHLLTESDQILVIWFQNRFFNICKLIAHHTLFLISTFELLLPIQTYNNTKQNKEDGPSRLLTCFYWVHVRQESFILHFSIFTVWGQRVREPGSKLCWWDKWLEMISVYCLHESQEETNGQKHRHGDISGLRMLF